MHELSATNHLIELISNECQINKIKSPKKIIVELGMLTTYKKDPILFYFDLIKKDIKLLKNSKLVIKEVKGKILCNKCKKESVINEAIMIFCQKCNSGDVEIINGKDLILKEIDA
jgi:hydrogenase nickel incorporation protein HypA/HybF